MREQRQETSDFYKELFSIWGLFPQGWLGLLWLDKLFELYTKNNIYVIDADVDDEKEDKE